MNQKEMIKKVLKSAKEKYKEGRHNARLIDREMDTHANVKNFDIKNSMTKQNKPSKELWKKNDVNRKINKRAESKYNED